MRRAVGCVSEQLLAAARPATFAAAGRLPGVTPAGLLALLAYVKRRVRPAAAA